MPKPPASLRCPTGHDEVLGRLLESLVRDRLPHALLFTGPEGIGKSLAAHWLAARVFCVASSDQPCRECSSCLQVEALSHPDLFVEGGRFLIGMKTSFALPSAHAMNWFAQAALFTHLYPKRWWLFFSFAAPVAFSRVYVGVHYPADVAVGAVLGAGVGTGVYWGYRWARVAVRKSRGDSGGGGREQEDGMTEA